MPTISPVTSLPEREPGGPSGHREGQQRPLYRTHTNARPMAPSLPCDSPKPGSIAPGPGRLSILRFVVVVLFVVRLFRFHSRVFDPFRFRFFAEGWKGAVKVRRPSSSFLNFPSFNFVHETFRHVPFPLWGSPRRGLPVTPHDP